MKLRIVLSLALGLWGVTASALANAKGIHVVGEGDTLWAISRSYGCDLEALRETNDLQGDQLPIGRTLVIPPGSKQVAVAPVPEPVEIRGVSKISQAAKGGVTYQILAGDTLSEIASQYDTSVEDLVERNGLENAGIFAGHSLKVLPGAGGSGQRFVLGQSIGATNGGHLRNPTKLRPGTGYFIRRP